MITSAMDGLLAEISAKRKAIQDDQRPNKYMRRGDIEKLKEEKERKEKEERETALQHKKSPPTVDKSPTPQPESDKLESSFNISNEETIRRLRAKGQPIRLFAESDKDRRLRLRALELIEEKGHDKVAGQNDFKKALEDVENSEREKKDKNHTSKGKKKDDGDDGAAPDIIDLKLVKTSPDKVYPLIYYALKRVLKEWAEAMDARPGVCCLKSVPQKLDYCTEHIKQTHQGKLAAATQVQSAEYLKPLFKQLRSRASQSLVFSHQI